ncbi:MAG: nucleotide pyrophosphatase/phosphodiesterase family protein [bacterium]
MKKRLVIIQAAGLGYDFLTQAFGQNLAGLQFRPLESVFPALTCTVQASFRTATPVSSHGMVANGRFHRELRRPLLWEQSSALVSGPRIWDTFRQQGNRVAMLFWQQSLGEAADTILSPAPIHKHGGGMVQSVYCKPAGLYESLSKRIGRTFPLHRYWGPLASPSSSDWIARATALLLADPNSAPDLCLTYLPALDYDLQRHGPTHPSALRSLETLMKQIALIRDAADRNGYDVIIFGDYAISPVTQAIFPNRALLQAGLFQTRTVAGMLYPDFHSSQAFAMVDHEIAHIYLRTPAEAETTKLTLSAVEGIDAILGPQEQHAAGIAHPHSGELILVAKPGYWFAYPWWIDKRKAPDFASHVDIHNKPGYDPCELFFGWPPISVSQDTSRILGSHGALGAGRQAAWAATCPLPGTPTTLLELANVVKRHLEAAS